MYKGMYSVVQSMLGTRSHEVFINYVRCIGIHTVNYKLREV